MTFHVGVLSLGKASVVQVLSTDKRVLVKPNYVERTQDMT